MNRHRSQLTWDQWKANCARVDCLPFMAFRGVKNVHTARYNPSRNRNHLAWVRNQEATARSKNATFICYVDEYGKTIGHRP